ncbi:hypothetical protein [Vibrio parahaemolyticus]|uniref:hypothetical protein n=1 Tax=Vibrio parahaemolyticus TaxID=670 RepID=UPI0039EC007D
MKRFYSLFALPFISTLVLANDPLPDRQTELPAVKKENHGEYLQPRDLSKIPNTAFGEQVKCCILFSVAWHVLATRVR